VVVSDGLKCTESNFWSWRIIGLAGTLVLFFNLYAGCGIPVSRTTIIPKVVAQTTEQLIGKLDLLKTGMEIGEVYELLDIKRTTPGVRENRQCGGKTASLVWHHPVGRLAPRTRTVPGSPGQTSDY